MDAVDYLSSYSNVGTVTSSMSVICMAYMLRQGSKQGGCCHREVAVDLAGMMDCDYSPSVALDTYHLCKYSQPRQWHSSSQCTGVMRKRCTVCQLAAIGNFEPLISA